ncbi:putative oxoglutarate dehydrogenase precursor [Serendipita vermifera]|nr:putative oxoglutarate dehydrogenase precursor [Serendipita vermifera]
MPDYTPAQLENRAKNAALLRYVDSFRMHGHRAAFIDPLNKLQRDSVSALDPARYGLADPHKEFELDGIVWYDGTAFDPTLSTPVTSDLKWTLERITSHLRDVYVGSIAYEYMHSPSKSERLWFAHLLESEDRQARANRIKKEDKIRILNGLIKSEVMDTFLQDKFPNLKRYGLEGAESMIPALDTLFASAASAGIGHVLIGMPHRGRLNLLTDLLKYPPRALFHKIKGNSELPEWLGATGDVISHLAITEDIETSGGKLTVQLLQNPSHLEAINPVVLGKTRGKQYSLLHESDSSCMLGDKVMCVQLHGDAAFTGQGVVMESLGLSNLPHFTSGGSIHLVINNNVGYTTPGTIARSSLYCSDIGKMINAPVLHVNGDLPEEVARAMKIAFQYRNFFRKDIIVDLITYRRWGHNELDEPSYTQPLMYEEIRQRESVPKRYEQTLIESGIVDQSGIEQVRRDRVAYLQSELDQATTYTPKSEWDAGQEQGVARGKWTKMVWPASKSANPNPDTGVDKDTLLKVGKASVAIPSGFNMHERLRRHISARVKSLDTGSGINWATAESLAFGSLMSEGFDVRISGQDVGRGTFSHRHAMFVDQKNENVIVPLNDNISGGRLELANSSLSEFAVLGFEYGMSWDTPDLLPIWEAQFGDFFNGAQVIIDTFVTSSQTKWAMQSGIVMLLPHGLDGAGPEHSSMRIERMLQLTNDPFTNDPEVNVNMTVANPTTSAQYFHLLRRQMKRNFRKPLIVAAPKGLLRSPAASSDISSFEPGTSFLPVIDDASVAPEHAKGLVIVSGKIYHDLVKERSSRGLEKDIAIVRLEELCPFPFGAMESVLKRYSQSSSSLSIKWVQEEPENQGAWPHVMPRMQNILDKMDSPKRVQFVGRRASEVPAVGVGKVHSAQVTDIFARAFA